MRRFIGYLGREMLLCEWAREFNIPRKTLSKRLAMGWSIKDALNRPIRPKVSLNRAEAVEKGEYHYDSIPCKNCGCKIRITRNSDCPSCKRIRHKLHI